VRLHNDCEIIERTLQRTQINVMTVMKALALPTRRLALLVGSRARKADGEETQRVAISRLDVSVRL
jgi:hypothetical protein